MKQIIMIGPGKMEKGGIATVISNFETYFSEPNINITYLVSWQSGHFLKRLYVFLKCCIHLILLLHKDSQQIVHLHCAQDGSYVRKYLLSQITHYYQSALIIHFHASQFDTFYHNASKSRQRRICSWLDKAEMIVVLSIKWEKFYRNLTTAPIKIIENAVPIPGSNPYQNQGFKIATFGRIGKRKGSYDILTIAQKMQTHLPEIEFWLYGDGEVEKFAELIKEKELTNVFLGGWVSNQSELQQVYRESLLHFLPSYHEGLPMSVLETMAAGIPNVCSTVGGIPDVIRTGENGFLAEAGDIAELSASLLLLIEEKDLRQSISQKSYQTIAAKFSIESYCQSWASIYQRM